MTIIIMQKTKSILCFPGFLTISYCFSWCFLGCFCGFCSVFPPLFILDYAFHYNIKRSWIEPMVCVFLKYNFFIESKMCFRLIFTSIVNCYYYGIYTVPHLVSFTSSTYLRIDVLIILCNSVDFKIYILWGPP